MKLIMTLLVRDEEDILKENIDFHLSQGVDFIIATDNCSIDSTKTILQEYEKRGLLHYIYEKEDNYNQHKWVTRMARLALLKYQADWIINNDADEFWWSKKHKNLKEAFNSIQNKYNIVEAKRSNFIPFEEMNPNRIFYQEMIYREYESLNPIGKPLPPKQAHIALKNIRVNQGNHSVEGIENKKIIEDLIEIFHFPIRNKKQLLNKINKGGAAYAKNTELSKNIGNTWRKLYAELQKNGNLNDYFNQNIYTEEELKKGLKENHILKDTRLKEYLNQLKSLES
jgi:hypothetical protein